MAPHKTNAAQHAEPVQVPINLSALNHINKTDYQKDEDGAFIDRPNLDVQVTMSYATEDYVRILKTLADVRPVLRRALQETHGEKDGTLRYNEMIPHLNRFIAEISGDMGEYITDVVMNWQGEYM